MNGVAFLTIHKRLENTGNVPIDIAAEALSVYGERIVQRYLPYPQANLSCFGIESYQQLVGQSGVSSQEPLPAPNCEPVKSAGNKLFIADA